MKKNPIYIAIWARGHDRLDCLIRFLTHGRGSHAAFVRGSGKIVENFYPAVRERSFKAGERRNVELYTIAGINSAESARLERWFDAELGKRKPMAYSIRNLFRYAINWPPLKGNQSFCSSFVLRGLRECLPPGKQPLVRLEHVDYASPRDLRISPVLIPHLLKSEVASPGPYSESEIGGIEHEAAE